MGWFRWPCGSAASWAQSLGAPWCFVSSEPFRSSPFPFLRLPGDTKRVFPRPVPSRADHWHLLHNHAGQQIGLYHDEETNKASQRDGMEEHEPQNGSFV